MAPRIAPHHSWKDNHHRPSDEWPGTCLVQWGAGGVVLSENGARRTAFFEAFPEGCGFIRGEGGTIKEAEEDALGRYRRTIGCEHMWCRGGYLNGGAKCSRCGIFGAALRPVVRLGSWGDPLNHNEMSAVLNGDVWPDPEEKDRDYLRFERRRFLRLRRAGIRPPEPPDGFCPLLAGEDDPYIIACRDALCSWIHDGHLDGLGGSGASSGLMEKLLSGVMARDVREAYAEWLRGKNSD